MSKLKFQNEILKQVQNDTLVMPDQDLNLALNQVQGLSNLIFDFGISFGLWISFDI